MLSSPTVSSFVSVNPPVRAPPEATRARRVPDEERTSGGAPLGAYLAGDVAVATAVTALAAPFLTVVDKAVVQKSAGSHTLFHSARESFASMLRHPAAYLRSPTYLWMWGTYAVSYAAANSLRTATEFSERQKYDMPVSSNTALFAGTTAVNSTASLIKDRAYAKLFGSSAVTHVPAISYGLWMARDFAVIGSSFVLPSHVADYLKQYHNMEPTRAMQLAQFATPVAAQLVASPLHYVGLDVYNNNLSEQRSRMSRVRQRWANLRAALPQVIVARMLRILPGYSITGVLNTKLRKDYREQLQQQVRLDNYCWPTALQQLSPV